MSFYLSLEIEEHAKELSIIGDEQIRQQREHEEQLQNVYAAHDKEKQDLIQGHDEQLLKMKEKFEGEDPARPSKSN